jgi:hypothetical protein
MQEFRALAFPRDRMFPMRIKNKEEEMEIDKNNSG